MPARGPRGTARASRPRPRRRPHSTEIIALTVSVDLDHRPPLTFYLSVGLVAGSIIALQIGIMRMFSVGSWAHFGSLVVSLAMFGFGLTSAVMCVGKGWFERHWTARSRARCCLRAADGGVQPRRPAGAVQRHLPDLRPDAEVAAARQLRALLPAVPGRRALSRRRLPEGAEDLQPRLFRRSRRARACAACRCCSRCTVFKPDDLIMAPLLLWLAGGVLWFVALRRPARHAGDRGRRGAVGRRALRGAAGCSASPSSRCRTTRASPTPASSPTASASTSAPRRSATSRSIPAPTCISRRASRTTPRSTCRRCRPTPISASTSIREGPSGIIKDLPADETAYFRYLPMYYPVRPEAGARHLRGAVRRRHLDRGGAEVGLEPRHGRRGQSRGADGVPRGQGPARLHRRHPATIPRSPSSTMTAASIVAAHQEPLRRHRPVARRFGRPVEPRRLRHRREVFLHARGDERLHARAEARRHPVGHAVEQGRAAQVGAEALRHHGGRGARRRRRRTTSPRNSTSSSSYLSTATVLYKRGGFTPRRSRSSTPTPRRCRSTRSTIPASRSTTSELTQILQDYRDQFFFEGDAGRSDGAVGEGAERQAAARHDGAARRGRRRRGRRGDDAPPRRACRRPCSAGSPGTI